MLGLYYSNKLSGGGGSKNGIGEGGKHESGGGGGKNKLKLNSLIF